MAIRPPPPGRVSTIRLMPSVVAILGAIARAIVSCPPPGATPRTRRIGRSGKFCAAPGRDSEQNKTAAKSFPVVDMVLLLLLRLAPARSVDYFDSRLASFISLS